MENRDIIEVTEYKNGFKTYTAKWCNPCKLIKPSVAKYLEGVEITNEFTIDKNFYKMTVNKFIPFFVYETNSIQTSNEKELKQFLIDNKIIQNTYSDTDF